MQGRHVWRGIRLGVALLVLTAGLAAAQQTAPVSWPQLDVWGVSGHPVGSIRLSQPTINGVVRYSLIGEFTPTNGQTLDQMAAILWPGAGPKCLHFNWVQVTTDPGKPPLPTDSQGHFLTAPFLDPPAGGYFGDKKSADDLPWFLDETAYTSKLSADTNIHNPQMTLPNVLRWFSQPYSQALPDAMHYDTVLVLINDCTGQYEPLGGFHWTANFPAQGTPSFTITPFGPQEWFSYGDLISGFAPAPRSAQKPRVWTIRPLVKLLGLSPPRPDSGELWFSNFRCLFLAPVLSPPASDSGNVNLLECIRESIVHPFPKLPEIGAGGRKS